MQKEALKSRTLLLIAAGYFCLHAIGIRLALPNALPVSYLFMLFTPCVAVAVCVWKARRSGPRMSTAWAMIASGIAVWTLGMAVSAGQYATHHRVPDLDTLSGFLFFAYGIPMLLVIASPMEGERSALFVWLDSVQAACVGCLIYVMLFGGLPFWPHAAGVASMGLVVNAYNVESLFLAVSATVRLFLHARSRQEGRMYWILSAFLWTYGVCAAVNNYVVFRQGDGTGYVDLLADIPFLVLMVYTLLPPKRMDDTMHVVHSRQVAVYLDNASHTLATLTLLALGALNVRSHYRLGMASIAVALAVYALRTTMLQNRLLRSQRALREAKERLEALSLEDPLTRVANRRCFDVTLEREWKRGVRNGALLSLLMIDLDHFKSLNDLYGHVYGDQCLVNVARTLTMALPRADDLVARYGGEEFAAVLIATDRQGAEIVAERMRVAVTELGVTVSVGIATFQPMQGQKPGVMVEAADRALYRAKLEGRDRFVSHEVAA